MGSVKITEEDFFFSLKRETVKSYLLILKLALSRLLTCDQFHCQITTMVSMANLNLVDRRLSLI